MQKQSKFFGPELFKRFRLFFAIIFTISSAAVFHAQELPNKMRGYKIYRADILISEKSKGAASGENNLRVEFDFDEPNIADISLSGITLSLGGALTVFGQSGKVDFITFEDFTVNKIPVKIAEYKDSFEFAKGEAFQLKKPVEIFVNSSQTLRGIVSEKRESKEKWQVSGKVFIFGQFRKFGFHFKRVIPVTVDMEIENPIRRKVTTTN